MFGKSVLLSLLLSLLCQTAKGELFYMLTVEAFGFDIDSQHASENIFTSYTNFYLVKVRDMETGNLLFYKPFCERITHTEAGLSNRGEPVKVRVIVHNSFKFVDELDGRLLNGKVLKDEIITEGENKLCFEGTYQRLKRDCWKAFKIDRECRTDGATVWIDVASCHRLSKEAKQ